ncbi:aldehyde dehydrogenase [Kaistella antarctica]|uniref:Aldehyde dehydrogenase n=1 Tax=Kaistella antarctica TaxID=266748 RepID=A0A3S4UYU9_9FLAO|nr:aldehyde dehydrogenase [Kaistella antarctica]KEY19996.1 aldehyde dehydrogenase [Kaistella antarctica]SEV94966.1 aldehyde dehydrogenase (NAD+) [Kaistella antarctica]VEH95804.1 Coniferyl aldehyde dehydrogenase [Kaistella antarctica]
MNFQDILSDQREFFNTQKTKNIKFRKMYLEKLKEVIQKNESLLYEAIYADFGKSKFDTFTTEISFVLKDIDYYLKNLNSLAKPKRVGTNLANQLGSSKIYPEPLGCTLVIGAWNYPYQLSFSPMIAALAAGNTCILKPSEIAENSMKVMAKIINENFPKEYLYVVEGGVEEITEILKLKFDKIFFTGSSTVGKIVYEAAAKHLTPVTLELGGKSPAIVTSSANFEVAAKRIVWGKFLNAGQTCVAPDYILVDEKVKDSFLDSLKSYIQKFNYGIDAEQYTRIINEKNYNRLINLIDQEKIFYGGKTDSSKNYIEPTLLHNVTWDDAVMQEEIFGPILPILTFKNFNEALLQISAHDKPLAAYLFTSNSDEKESFTSKVSFGGGCINDVVMHLSNDHLPFGGVGNSGIGNYHGKYGFQAFSHMKSILDRATWGEPDLKYPPYSEKKLSWIKKLL